MRRSCILFLSLFFLLNSFSYLNAQMPGVFMHRNAKKIEIPFERQDNFIIVKVIFGKLFPLRFIVDTGAEHTILTKREISDLLGMEYERTINLVGTDLKTQVTAYIARKARLDLPTITFVKDILVLDQDYFQFDKFAGLDVHGVLGAEAFKGYVLKFDFTKQILTMYDPSVFRTSDHKKYEELPIEIIRSKPYLNTKAQILNDSAVNLKLLIDTGAALSLLLHTYSVPGLFLPPKVIKGNIGTGLGGEIEGFVGRIRSIHVGSHKMGAPVSNFQELNTASDTAYLNRRNGLMGGEILCRFNFIIDFAREKLYIQPNRYFKEAFVYDRSGLILIAGGNLLNTFTVHDIVPHSPAEEAGILRGDEILKINGLIARFYNLGALNQKLQAKVGKTIRLQILRNGQKMNFSFKLRDLV